MGFADGYPESLRQPLHAQLAVTRALHRRDLGEGVGEVYLPFALARKYPNAAKEWMWQYVFPAERISRDPRSGTKRRHHLDGQLIERAMRLALRAAGIHKPATPHTLRHYAVFRTMPSPSVDAARVAPFAMSALGIV